MELPGKSTERGLLQNPKSAAVPFSSTDWESVAVHLMNILTSEGIEVYLRAKKAGCVPPVFCLEPTSGLTPRAVVLPTRRRDFDKKAPAVAGALMAEMERFELSKSF